MAKKTPQPPTPPSKPNVQSAADWLSQQLKPPTPAPPDPRVSVSKVVPGKYVPPVDTKNPTFFEKIRKKMNRYGLKALSMTARNWLKDSVNKTKVTPNRNKIINEGTPATQFVGNMFMFFYNAKTKEDLPYWDKFPLIFVIDLYEDGWLGLNLHYLPLVMRIKLFDRLLMYADSKKLDQITKLRLSYALVKTVSQFPEVAPCVKRYLASFVKSELIKVEAVDWEIAAFLPVEQFQKQPKERVWKDSKAKVVKK